ncbi:P-loop-containing protein [Planktomarina sp.]|jgi:hypothetical protein|uniref:P-loop-containing protein n=1 Tax=Planktomarina sp. TaxID=2024851 RepID=UPI003260CF9F
MRHIFAIGGIPGTGKTTLVKNALNNLALDWEPAKPAELLDGVYSKARNCYVFGKYAPWYDVEGYAQGTDKLSMAVQPKAIEFIAQTNSSIIFEGDRLFTASLLETCLDLPETELHVIILESDDVEQRYKDRGSEQSDKFIQGRKTKYNNIAKNFLLWENIETHKHNTAEDTESIVRLMDIGITL